MSPAALQEFVEIYKREFGIDLTPDEASEAALNLLSLYKAVYSAE